MKKLATIMAVLLLWPAAILFAADQAQSGKAADCSTYARNRAESETSAGSSALAGGVRGGAGGALFGAIIGGSKGAKRGAMLGGGVGAVSGGARSSQDRQARYKYYYDECMRGNTN
jgi:hypothetical protein